MKFHIVMKIPQSRLRDAASDLMLDVNVIGVNGTDATGKALNYFTTTTFTGLAELVSCDQIEESRFDIVGYNQLLVLAGALDHGLFVRESNVTESDVAARLSYWTEFYRDQPGLVVQARPAGFDEAQAQEMINVTLDAPPTS